MIDTKARRFLTIDLAMLQRMAFLHGCQVADAEDVAMEAWERLATADFHGESALNTYAFITVRNLCADRARKRDRRRTTSLEDETAEPVCNDAPVFAEMESRELHQAVRRVVKELTPIHQTVIRAHYFERQDVETIAKLHGVPAGTVKSRLHRARSAMERPLRGWKS